ncbi:hypothetical protein R2F61_02545 [Mollicutes bacterium LVI A0078]|nr:hypothetical protein RZE84_02575 [Mollicutes bacterium LVI A0075]WOO91449.1 hypothetical protein R2F61_02545 [Mollicutes bacterium LVI A0078]
MRFEFTENGRIAKIDHEGFMINQIRVTDLDDHLINVYLRTNGEVISLMENVTSKYTTEENAIYGGMYNGQEFSIYFQANGNALNVKVDIKCETEFDFIFTLDLGLGEEGYLQTNEAYASQYLDHRVVTSNPIQIASRKTVSQAGKFPGLITSKLEDFVAFNTDGYQTFKSLYRDSKNLNNLMNDLENSVYQYEFAMLSLQSKKCKGQTVSEFNFCFIDNVTSNIAWDSAKFPEYNDIKYNLSTANFETSQLLSGDELTQSEISEIYPTRELEEEGLSFFVGNTHVVTKQKEMQMERNHGHIVTSGSVFSGNEEVLSNTMYMNGYFGGQISVGNTDFNQLLTPLKNGLNMNRGSGLRMYVNIDEKEYQLGLPSIFEMGLNSAKWIYKLGTETITITSYISMDTNEVYYTVNSPFKTSVSMQIDMKKEFNIAEGDVITITPNNEYVLSKCPELNYSIKGLTINEKLQSNIIKFDITNDQFSISGSKTSGAKHAELSFEQSVEETTAKYDQFLNGFKINSDSQEITKFNQLTRWYVHNAMVHYGTPRGLEQYIGAAWGTRDVLQGPLELFLTLQKFDLARDIIKRVYTSQFDDGNWSQWFMFDEYIEVAAGESHGDVVVWPFKAIAMYIQNTGDLSILDEEVTYKLRTNPFTFSSEKFTILDHLKTQWNYVQNNLLEGTYLPCYGDGDWDDTLQPKNAEQRKNMASGWTVSLLFEALTNLSKQIESKDQEFAKEIKEYTINLKSDYFKYMVEDNVCAGFIIKEGDKITKLLHPTDNMTGIEYRLLPINRGIISEMFDNEHIEKGIDIIDTKLKCNDGIRLMDKPANYDCGYNTLFQRAEQASTVGREVGLQYVHAHIRYAEAMAKLGKEDRVLFGLNQIQPFDNNRFVKNTMLKQRNAYFSSSEGNFKTRYDFQENFDKLKEGSVEIKTGWRIYSSGPGIYLNQLIRNVFGIKVDADSMQIDPVLPADFSSTSIDYNAFGKAIKFEYKKAEQKSILINGEELKPVTSSNKYKDNDYVISKEAITSLNEDTVTIQINY